jgi:Na+/H+-dicarboxylate symporter
VEWNRSGYGRQFVVVLEDQGLQGRIDAMTTSGVTVRLWEPRDLPEDVVYVLSEDGTRLPFRRVDGRLVSHEPTPDSTGTGVSIVLPRPAGAGGPGERTLGGTLREVLLGNDETGSQGLVPRNLLPAMTRMEILPLIVFALLFGAALSVLGDRGRPAIDVISALNDGVMQLVHWVILLAPVGIFGLVAARLGRAGGFAGFGPELRAVGGYTLTVLIGLGIHALVVLPLALRVLGRRRPLAYARGVGAALLNALSTASSSATLPLTMQGVEEENGVSSRTASFVLPLGATINMDGTAMYESVAAIFIAQVYGIPLGPGEQLIVFITATLAAIGAAGIPEAGLVTMVIVLTAVGLPVEGVGLVLTVDWLLDRFRTTVNVWGDSVGAAVIDRYERRPRGATPDVAAGHASVDVP